MRYTWQKIKSIFIKKYREEVIETFIKEKLTYTGEEPNCWACDEPIHKTHRSRKLNGNKIHIICFKRLNKIRKKIGRLYAF